MTYISLSVSILAHYIYIHRSIYSGLIRNEANEFQKTKRKAPEISVDDFLQHFSLFLKRKRWAAYDHSAVHAHICRVATIAFITIDRCSDVCMPQTLKKEAMNFMT
jgi:hypothetical protein